MNCVNIIDFGTCLIIRKEEKICIDMTTEEYRSPGSDIECTDIDQYSKIDIWSLGTILGELYCGKIFFKNYTDIPIFLENPMYYCVRKNILDTNIIELITWICKKNIKLRPSCDDILNEINDKKYKYENIIC
jgi:serine/threonine protein kinase